MFSEEVVKKDWLFKQSRFLKAWHRRYAVLTKTHLITYKSEDTSAAPTEVLVIADCNAIRTADDETKKPNSFKLIYQYSEFFFYVDHEKNRTEWLQVVSKVNQRS